MKCGFYCVTCSQFCPFECGDSPLGPWQCCCSVSRRRVNGMNNWGGGLLLNSHSRESVRVWVFPSHTHRSNNSHGHCGSLCRSSWRREAGRRDRGGGVAPPDGSLLQGWWKDKAQLVPCHFCFLTVACRSWCLAHIRFAEAFFFFFLAARSLFDLVSR